jgi:hypothetical protein
VTTTSSARDRQLDHDWIATEHLLHGLLLARTGLAADVLMDSGITPQQAEREAQRVIVERQ